MPQAPDNLQPVNPGFGYSTAEPHPFWKALEGVVRGLQGMQLSKGSTNPWGMHEPTLMASEAVQPAMTAAGNVLSDPRNSWMGVGPLAGMAMIKQAPGFTKQLLTQGGGNMPTSAMRGIMDMPRPNLKAGVIPGGSEQRVRDTYMQTMSDANKISDILMDLNHPRYGELAQNYQDAGHQIQDLVNKTMSGKEALLDEIVKQKASTSGGVKPPSWLKPDSIGYQAIDKAERNAGSKRMGKTLSDKNGQRGGVTSDGFRYNYNTQKWEPADYE